MMWQTGPAERAMAMVGAQTAPSSSGCVMEHCSPAQAPGPQAQAGSLARPECTTVTVERLAAAGPSQPQNGAGPGAMTCDDAMIMARPEVRRLSC
jgi:hypothetical protein